MTRPTLARFLQQAKPESSLGSVLGYFSPGGLHLEVLIDPETDSESNRIQMLGTLLHERVHWLQHVGTSVGLFSSYLTTLQTNALVGENWAKVLPEMRLPLLEDERVSPDRRALWLACEAQSVAIFGGERAYFEEVARHGARFEREAISRYIRKIAEDVIGDPPPEWIALQDAIWSRATFSGDAGNFVQHRGSALGATHLMEAAARVNEVFKLAEYRERYSVSLMGAFAGEYGVAREVFYDLSGAPESAESEMVLCVLADWALMTLLPPVFPLIGDEPRAVITPAHAFVALARNYDPSVVPKATEGQAVRFADELALALYRDITERVDFPSPLEAAQVTEKILEPLARLTVPELMYSAGEQPGLPEAKGPLARLRYLSWLALRACKTRREHPAFFALPISYYHQDRAFFHALFDPIQPPLWSFPGRRLMPTRDDPDWLGFFFSFAVSQDALAAAAYCEAPAIGRRLGEFRGTSLHPDNEAVLVRTGIGAVFGESPMAEEIFAAWQRT